MIKKTPPFPVGLKKAPATIYPDAEQNRNRFGRMVYGEETAGEICVMTSTQFSDFKSYEPGRHGISAVKVVSEHAANLAGIVVD
jgi:hypothetical protein